MCTSKWAQSGAGEAMVSITAPLPRPSMLYLSLGKYELTSEQRCDGEAEAAGQPGERAED